MKRKKRLHRWIAQGICQACGAPIQSRRALKSSMKLVGLPVCDRCRRLREAL